MSEGLTKRYGTIEYCNVVAEGEYHNAYAKIELPEYSQKTKKKALKKYCIRCNSNLTKINKFIKYHCPKCDLFFKVPYDLFHCYKCESKLERI